MFKIKKDYIGYIILIITLLSGLCFSVGSVFIPVFYIVDILFLFFLFTYKKDFFSDLLFTFKKTPAKYLMFFILYSLFTVIISIIQNTFYLKSFVYGCIGGLIFFVLISFIAMLYAMKYFLTPQKVMRFYLIFILSVFLLGILEHIIKLFDYNLAVNTIGFFNNKSKIVVGQTHMVANRIKSIFDEPGGLGHFIYLNIPILLSVFNSKYKIFKNKYINIIMKKGMLILALICLSLTKSPISILVTGCILFLYFYKNLWKILKKHLFFIILSLLILIITALFLVPNIDIYESYLSRIIYGFSFLFDINNLILVEPSLATRIIVYANLLHIFICYPIFGVGYGNTTSLILAQLEQSELPLTQELGNKVAIGNGGVAMAIFYKTISETGIIGIFLLYTFWIKILNNTKKWLKYLSHSERAFYNGVKGSLLVIIFWIPFYGSSLHDTTIWIIPALLIFLEESIIQRKVNRE